MIDRKILLATVLVLLTNVVAAVAAERWRLASVPLDMPMDDGLDDQALEGLYQGDYGTHMPHNFGGYLGGNVKSSGLTESPFWHIDTVLKDGRKLELWFSSAEDGRKIFGIHLETPWIEKPTIDASRALADVQAAYGKPDLDLPLPPDKGGQRIQVFVDRTVPQERYTAVAARLPAAGKMSAKDVEDFWRVDLRELARILGPEFRGAIVIIGADKGKLVSQQTMLIDLARARSIFNLGETK